MIHDPAVCELGEGPLWHPLRQELFWFDILSKRLHRKGQFWQFDRHVSAAGWVDQTRLLIADSAGLFLFDLESGASDPVCALEADNPVTRTNDGRADPWGGLWISTMGIGLEEKAGAIYRYHRGEMRQLFSGLSIPNAICFAPDGSHACFTDTTDARILRQRLSDKDGWPVGDPDPWLDLRGSGLSPDGAVIDTEGRFWNAQWGAGRVACYDAGGELVETVAFAAEQTSCPAFGGPELSTLFCTSAADGLDTPGPHDGQTQFAHTTTKGQAEHQIIL